VEGLHVFWRKALIIFIISLLIVNLFSVAAFADEYETDYDAVQVDKIMNETDIFNLKSKAAILVDVDTGGILYKHNEHEQLPIASVTKIMSMLLVMEAVENGTASLNDIVTTSEYAYGFGGSQVYLKPGEKFTLDEMLKAIAIHSANDATVAVAEHIAGSEDAFVKKMNEKAKELGMKNTNFLDCTGLTDVGHYSSAYDVAIMSRELIWKYPKIMEYTSKWYDTFRDGTFDLYNRNKLIRFYDGATGIKTGFTTAAGHCLSASARRNGLHLIAVVLGGPDSNVRYAETRKLLDYGFANFEVTQIEKKGTVIKEVTVEKGLQRKVTAVYAKDVSLLLKKGDKDKIVRELNLPEAITAPVMAGQKIGEVVYKIGDKKVATVDVIAGASVEKASFGRLLLRMILDWFGIGRD